MWNRSDPRLQVDDGTVIVVTIDSFATSAAVRDGEIELGAVMQGVDFIDAMTPWPARWQWARLPEAYL